MDVTFALRLWHDSVLTIVPEDQLRVGGAGAKALIDPDAYGQVEIAEAGAPGLAVEDRLESLVRALCLQSAPDLVGGTPVEVAFQTYYGELLLVPEGNRISIARDGRTLASYGAPELLRALVACGERFVAAMKAAYGPGLFNAAVSAVVGTPCHTGGAQGGGWSQGG